MPTNNYIAFRAVDTNAEGDADLDAIQFKAGMAIVAFDQPNFGRKVETDPSWRIIETDLPLSECEAFCTAGINNLDETQIIPRREFMYNGILPPHNSSEVIDGFISADDLRAGKIQTPRHKYSSILGDSNKVF